ncbi:MAG TPA: two-component regulator propeller domain-containing protein [Terriglobales bacterium]|nr:two-component regulator propeller domain-containing protein [Terriglobales bacterium]
MASHRLLLLSLRKLRTAIAATLASCFACVLLLAAPVHALDPNKRLTQYIHTSWRIQDGSLPTGMHEIKQTSDGFLWLVSLPGDIYRFDGVRFVQWHLPAGVPFKSASNVLADHAGGLWVVGHPELVHLKDGVVTSHFQLEGTMFQTVSEDRDGSLWMVRSRAPDAPLCQVTDLSFQCFGKADGIPISGIEALLADGEGGFWLGGQSALVHWHRGSSETYRSEGIQSLARGPDGTLWVGISGGHGLEQLKDGAVKPFVTPAFDGSSLDFGTLMFDRDGNLWVGTVGKGLFRIHGNVVDHYDHTNGLSGDSVWALFEDREGIVWAGTTSGIDSFRDPRVATFSPTEGLGKDLAAGILASRDGTIWVANAGSLDHIVNGNVSSIRAGRGLPGEQVTSMLEDHAGNMWVGVDDALYLFKDGHFRRLPEPNHQPLGMVLGLTEDSEGNLWAACKGHPRKLIRIRDFQVREVFPEPDFPPADIAADPHGGIWMSTTKGDMALFRNGVVETKYPLDPGGYPITFQIIPAADGSVLAGSERGLVGWRAGKVQRMTTKNGLPCDSIITFIEDKDKRWWLYTRCGVVEFSDSDVQRWWANPDAIVQTRVYDTFDGAQPNNGSFNLVANSSDGRIWFASGIVVQVIDPSRLSPAPLPAAALVESVTANRKLLAATHNISLPPHLRDLQIDYTSPTFLIPQKVRFRYRLDPYDRDWHDAGTRRQAFYTDLPPGKYSFRVIASNSDGVWNETAAKLDFTVAPAYYQTNWFRALCVIALLGLLWAAYQFRVRQLQQQFAMTLDARVSERTRIARDLHDTLLQSFQGLLPRFQAAIYKLPENAVDARHTLEVAVDQASQAITEGRDAVKGLRASTVEKNDLAMAIRAIAEDLASSGTNPSSPAFQVTVEGTPRNLHPILRDEVYRIAAEALRNAFRHAQAHQIEVELRYDEKDFRLRIRDDGKGIDRELLSGDGREGHFGLHGMRERAKLVGGELAIWSEVDSGTEVELSIPASRAYSKSVRRLWFLGKF